MVTCMSSRGAGCRSPPCRRERSCASVVQKFKGRVLVVDWSLSKHDYGASGANGAPADPVDAPAATTPAGGRGPTRGDAADDSGAESSAADDAEAVPNGSERSELTEHADGGGDAGGDVGCDAALEIRPEEKQMYRSVLGGLLRDEDTAAGGLGGRAEGAAGASAEGGREGGKAKKRKRAEAAEAGQAGADAVGAAAEWEGERAKQPEGQGERSGSGVINTQVFVRGLPADATSVELTARMSRFGEVAQCRCGLPVRSCEADRGFKRGAGRQRWRVCAAAALAPLSTL